MIRLLIIDGFNLIRRVYSAVPGDEGSDAHRSGFIRSVLASAQRSLKQHEPSHAVLVLESAGNTWRHELFPTYKSGRKPQPEPLISALPELCERLNDEIHINTINVDGYEADDVTATIATRVAAAGGNTVILSTDHLHCQLASNKIHIVDHFQNRALDYPFVMKRYGITPALLPQFYALAGHNSVGIHGIKGIGAKTAAALLKRFGSIEAMLQCLDTLPDKQSQQIEADRDNLSIYQRLFQLKTDVVINANLKQWRLPHD